MSKQNQIRRHVAAKRSRRVSAFLKAQHAADTKVPTLRLALGLVCLDLQKRRQMEAKAQKQANRCRKVVPKWAAIRYAWRFLRVKLTCDVSNLARGVAKAGNAAKQASDRIDALAGAIASVKSVWAGRKSQALESMLLKYAPPATPEELKTVQTTTLGLLELREKRRSFWKLYPGSPFPADKMVFVVKGDAARDSLEEFHKRVESGERIECEKLDAIDDLFDRSEWPPEKRETDPEKQG